MKRCLALLALVASPLLAQVPPGHRLPPGPERPVRERDIDVLKILVELTIDLEEHSVAGSLTTEFSSLRDGLDALSLDAAGLAVQRVDWLPDGEELEFEIDARRLQVSLPSELAFGEKGSVKVTYSAHPESGLYFFAESSGGGAQAWNYGEGGLHYGWLPLYNDTNDRFAVEFRLRADEPYVALANGTLLETLDNGDGTRTFHWAQEQPIPNYLLALDVGEFANVPARPARVATGEIPVSSWGPPGMEEAVGFAFRDTPEMIEFFSKLFDRAYPWPKYDQIVLREFISAMETTGLVGYTESYPRGAGDPVDSDPSFAQAYPGWTYWDTIAHELAHHWFGDLVTCRSLGSLWLNESFATFAHTVWNGHKNGEDDLTYQRWRYLDSYLDYVRKTGEVRPLEYRRYEHFEQPYQMETTYFKGALVLHMLRHFVGDETFYRTLSDYLETHAFGSVESTDLQAAFERAGGLNLDWFFGDWIVGGGGHPNFVVSSQWNAGRGQVDLTIDQVQADLPFENAFELPVDVEIVTEHATTRHTVQVEGWATHASLPADAEPLAVVFDPGHWIVSELRHDRPLREVLVQLDRGGLAAQLRALRQLATDFPRRPEAVAALGGQLGDDTAHWGSRQEAARGLGSVGGEAATGALIDALSADDSRVRRAAALALGEAGGERAARALRSVVKTDAAQDVVAVAARSLGMMHAPGAAAFLRTQLERDSRWWDAIRIGALEGLSMLEDPESLPVFRKYIDPRYRPELRHFALEGWLRLGIERAELSLRLREMATGESRNLRVEAIGKLGELHRRDDIAFLEKLAADQADPALATLARASAIGIRALVQ